MAKIWEGLTRNLKVAKAWGRNARVLVITELLWGIPMPWVFFYQTIFMRSLGMDEVLIGYLMTLPLVLQIFFPILGGHLADRFGRKRVLMLFDTVGWIGAMGTWFIATETWQVALAVSFQGLTSTTYGVWETLLVEDTDPPYRPSIYGSLQMIYIIGGLLTPLAGVLVLLHGVEAGCRYMFLTSLTTMACMLVIRQVYLRESEVGRALAYRKGAPSKPRGYIETLRTVTGSRTLLVIFVLVILGSVQYPMVDTYKPLYLSDPKGLALDESIISVIPAASSVPSLLALALIVPRLEERHMKKAIVLSYVCGISGLMTLVAAPKGSFPLAVASAVLDSARYIAGFSILRVYLANTIDKVDLMVRAKIMSLTATLSAVASWPAPAMAGYLYAVDPRSPFIAVTFLLALSTYMVTKIRS
ncbi:TPA: MFS transporter [Candidatus Bathyarchaeota archaeon]|nr:MFS transporter [Candidatus Bathyarchaeota archaeon]